MFFFITEFERAAKIGKNAVYRFLISLIVSLGSDEVLMSYYLFISSSHQHVQFMTSQILLISIDFDRVFDHFLIWNYSSLKRYNSGTRRSWPKIVAKINWG